MNFSYEFFSQIFNPFLLMIILGIIVAIVIFSIVVLIHELGHFVTARFFGVRVEEFGLGIPPRAKTLYEDKKGTIYSLNWLPLGGFVRLTGENINTFSVYDDKKKLYNNYNLERDIKAGKDVFDKNGYKLLENERKEILNKLKENHATYNLSRKPTWKQIIVILAGIFMNFLLAFFIFFSLFLIGVRPIGINDKIETNLDLKLIPTIKQAIDSGILSKSGDLLIVNKNFVYKYGVLDSAKFAVLETKNEVALTFKGIGYVLEKIFNPKNPKEREEALNSMSGPIGIVSFISDSLETGFSFLVIFGAIISINLGVFNLLPIPALDGGRFLFILVNSMIEKIFGKKVISEKSETILHLIFFVILIILSIIIAYNDISKIVK